MAPEADGAVDPGMGPLPSPDLPDAAFYVDGPKKGKKDRLFGNKMRDACWAQADVVGLLAARVLLLCNTVTVFSSLGTTSVP